MMSEESVRKWLEEHPCPDCSSVTGDLTQDDLGVWHVTMSHDATCPWMRQNFPPTC